MSNWKRVVYKQIQPIHIGYGSYGIMNETRIFIPGITMWGALINTFGRENNWTSKDYENEKNKKMFENITCFYPMSDNVVLYPGFKNGEFYLGDKSEKEFRYEYVDTYVSTAINPITLNAKDESLHEIDIILPRDKEDKKQLYWVGYVNTSENIPNEIYVGGDSRYGLGLMELVEEKREDYPYEVIKGIYQGKYPRNESLLNFLEFKNYIKFEGKFEILAEFDFSKNRPKVKKADYYIMPGSVVK
jgi:hypothetical protein